MNNIEKNQEIAYLINWQRILSTTYPALSYQGIIYIWYIYSSSSLGFFVCLGHENCYVQLTKVPCSYIWIDLCCSKRHNAGTQTFFRELPFAAKLKRQKIKQSLCYYQSNILIIAFFYKYVVKKRNGILLLVTYFESNQNFAKVKKFKFSPLKLHVTNVINF